MAEPELAGRTAELDAVRSFVDGLAMGSSALLIEGNEGIGKTTLWKAAVAEAERRGHAVLSARPARSEAQLSYSGLADLFLGRLDDLLPELPVPQAHALEVALRLEEPEGPPPDALAVSLATRSALHALSERAPVVVAIDDLQWLDGPTAQVVAFALRRLQDRSVGILAVVRPDEPSDSLDLDRGIPEGRIRRLVVGPLGVDELDRLLRSRLGAGLLRPHLTRLAQQAGGNPMLALEIGGALIRRGTVPEPGAPLPVPQEIGDLVRDRLAVLPSEVREALVMVAALSEPALEILGRAGLSEQIREAEAQGAIEIEDGAVRFSNPVVASVLYEDAPPEQRRRIHRELVEAVDTEEERARHLALATDRPDAAVAGTLEKAAHAVRARGAPYTAAELVEAALRLAPETDSELRDRLALQNAEYLLDAGDIDRARNLLEELIASSQPGDVRAEALQRLGWIRYRRESWTAAAQLFDEALREEVRGAGVEATLELDGAMARMLSGDLPGAAEHADRAMALARNLDRPDVLGEALAVAGSLDFLMGQGVPDDVMAQAESMESWERARPTLLHPSVAHGLLLKWSDDLDGARKRLSKAVRDATESGNERSLPFLLFHLAELECWAGNWAAAADHAARADDLATQTGQASSRSFTLYARALVDALRGETDAARTASLEGLELAEGSGARPVAVLHTANLGFLELSAADAGRANRYLGPLADAALEAGIHEPGVLRYLGDAAEALVGVGDVERAGSLLDALEVSGERVARISTLVTATRGRALLDAALGDLTSATSAAERSLERAERLGQPFELARTLLVLGTVRRRDRRKKDARDALERALEIFQGLGARMWAERVTEELGRIGGRAPASLALTPTEERVAAAVAEGHTNQEVAQALFMSVKTVEWNLSRIYRKVGVRSRTELARWLAARGEREPPTASR